MSATPQIEAKVESDGRTAFIVAGVVKTYDEVEARSLLDESGTPTNPNTLRAIAVSSAYEVHRPVWLAPTLSGQGTLEKFPWE